MNSETRRNVGELLAAQLDAIEADMSARSQPYRYAAELRDQRDSARRFAVDYEQTAYEMTRRVNLAQSYLEHKMPCDSLGHCGSAEYQCGRCEFEEILRGDR